MKIIFLASNFPDPVNKTWAPWNKSAVDSVLDFAEPTVIVPRPFAPPFSKFSKIPKYDEGYGYSVHYPRFLYLLPKSLFYCLTGKSYRYFVGRYALKAIEQGKIQKPDVIHALHPYLDGYGGVPIAKKLKTPLVITVHSPNNLKICSKKVLSALKSADKVVVIAKFLANELIEMGIPEEKVEYISLGVNPEEFKPLNREASKIVVPKYKLSANDKIVLYVGQLIPRKNLKTLLKAISLVLRELPEDIKKNVKFVIVGDGPEKNALQKLTHELKISSYVIFTGRVSFEELKEWYGVADIFVLPSLSEGKPVAIYEAMSSECAVVASNVNGIPEQVFDSVNGFLVNPNDMKGLARKIIYLLENEQELESMKKESRKLLFKLGYTWEEYGKRIKQVYDSL
ncbi:glycosyltransferase family 4 protein [Thermococcus sp. M39]|uniref:glycosyltransferase n=1 Tax=unclassified Thermococcus TaxID=2627626 RepID=UPI00143C85A1|nr:MULTISPECIES: glycosyltransferase [unclassified Thermococcus]NJE08446.1 glycosyltransferase family 4 protein [Thermococcus sp. M39]NJE11949.1 glycosyltransferase family 4 protein [Thermococcus sp. LS2]